MGKITPREAHEAAIAKAIKLHTPYMVVAGSLVGSDYPFAVVYTAPRGGDRQVVGERNKRANANSLRDQLSRAWVEGYYSSMYGKGL
jgi:hypothetical protein